MRIDDQLLTEIKAMAAKYGSTLTAIIEDALREVLAREKRIPMQKEVKLPTFRGRGLQPGIDLDDSASLWDLADVTDGTD